LLFLLEYRTSDRARRVDDADVNGRLRTDATIIDEGVSQHQGRTAKELGAQLEIIAVFDEDGGELRFKSDSRDKDPQRLASSMYFWNLFKSDILH